MEKLEEVTERCLADLLFQMECLRNVVIAIAKGCSHHFDGWQVKGGASCSLWLAERKCWTDDQRVRLHAAGLLDVFDVDVNVYCSSRLHALKLWTLHAFMRDLRQDMAQILQLQQRGVSERLLLHGICWSRPTGMVQTVPPFNLLKASPWRRCWARLLYLVARYFPRRSEPDDDVPLIATVNPCVVPEGGVAFMLGRLKLALYAKKLRRRWRMPIIDVSLDIYQHAAPPAPMCIGTSLADDILRVVFIETSWRPWTCRAGNPCKAQRRLQRVLLLGLARHEDDPELQGLDNKTFRLRFGSLRDMFLESMDNLKAILSMAIGAVVTQDDSLLEIQIHRLDAYVPDSPRLATLQRHFKLVLEQALHHQVEGEEEVDAFTAFMASMLNAVDSVKGGLASQ